MHKGRHYFILFIIAAVFFTSMAFSAQARVRTLKRTEDFIIIKGSEVPELTGSQVTELSLYAYGPTGFNAVPLQVDKRDPEGRYVFPDERIRDPLRDGTRLDQNDELVFMVRDAGDRFTGKAWVDGAARGVELEIVDPLDQGRAWLYIFDRPGTQRPDTRDYVDYMVKDSQELVLTDNYQYGKPKNTTETNMLRLRRTDGTWGENLVEGCMLGMRALLLNGAIPIRVREEEIRNWTQGVIDGPVRVIRYEIKLVRIKLIGLEMTQESYVINYFNANTSSMDVDIPFTLHKMFLNMDLYWYFTFTDAVIGSKLINQANPRGIRLDGKPDPDVDTETDTSYMVLTGPQGSMIDIIFLGDLSEFSILRSTLARDDMTKEDPSKILVGNILGGFWFKNTKKLPKGNYKFLFYHYYPYPFALDKVRDIENMVEHPVEINIYPVENSPLTPEG
jgi:hypothetical protein